MFSFSVSVSGNVLHAAAAAVAGSDPYPHLPSSLLPRPSTLPFPGAVPLLSANPQASAIIPSLNRVGRKSPGSMIRFALPVCSEPGNGMSHNTYRFLIL